MDEALRRRLLALRGSAPTAWRRVERGYTPAERWVVRFADGSSAFAKVGVTALSASCLRDELRNYQWLNAPFMPRLLAFDVDSEPPLLLLEDLTDARWPPPWQASDLQRFVLTMQQVAATRPLPADLPSLADDFGARGSELRASIGWGAVARDAQAFLSLGLCSAAWLGRALPRLREAQAEAVVEGDDLLHNDVRSDNLCFSQERGLLLIDWNLAGRGNGAFDLAFAAPSICLEGGPLPEALAIDDGPLASVVSGFFAQRASLPPIPDAPRVRWIQLEQLRFALPWVARALALPPPA
jgi:hypothetical protein